MKTLTGRVQGIFHIPNDAKKDGTVAQVQTELEQEFQYTSLSSALWLALEQWAAWKRAERLELEQEAER